MQKWSKRQLHERPIPYSCSERWRWSGSQDVVAVMRIRRLPLDCVRSEWAPEMVDDQGVQLEEAEHLWYLHVPSNKYRGNFWTPIPQYTAEAILAWKAVRPKNQPLLQDRKTGKLDSVPVSIQKKKDRRSLHHRSSHSITLQGSRVDFRAWETIQGCHWAHYLPSSPIINRLLPEERWE